MTIRSSIRSFALAAIITTSAAAAGCSDNPFALTWSADPDTTLIYSLARPEINLPSGFDFAQRTSVEIQEPGATGTWDVVLDTEGGDLVLRVPRFYNIDGEARIAVFDNLSFNEVLEAPQDTTVFISDRGVPMRLGSTYVIQTNLGTDRFGQRCRFYAKMEPLVLDVAQGTMQFVYDMNPLCEDLNLVAPGS